MLALRTTTAALLSLSLALLPLSACDKGGESSSAPAAPAEQDTQTPDEAGDSRDPSAKPGLTGLVDEDTFKALHELNEGEAPPLRGETIELAGTSAYLSLPEGASAPVPGIVVIHEWWGLTDHIRHWSDRLAADGYAALAVDLYGGEVAEDPDGAMALMKAVDAGEAAAVLAAAHAFLAEDPRVSAEARGVIGWCFGGGWALRQAIAVDDLDAAVIYYGHPITDPEQLANIDADLLGIFANEDQSIPPATVDEFVAALEAAGKSIEVHRYDANHAFANPSSGRYEQAAAAEAWAEVREFLARELKQE